MRYIFSGLFIALGIISVGYVWRILIRLRQRQKPLWVQGVIILAEAFLLLGGMWLFAGMYAAAIKHVLSLLK